MFFAVFGGTLRGTMAKAPEELHAYRRRRPIDHPSSVARRFHNLEPAR